MREGLPEEIRTLIGLCETNHISFSNEEMSCALHYAEACHDRLQNYDDPDHARPLGLPSP